jgi:hypothetical protein
MKQAGARCHQMGRSRISRPALAASLTVLASAFIGATTLLAKALGTAALGPPLSALQVSQGRFIFALVFICNCPGCLDAVWLII